MPSYRKAMSVSPMLELLYGLAAKHGLKVTEPSLGHFQIHGPMLVNYYPFGKNRTAYVDKTTKGKKDVSPQEAIDMALRPPHVLAKNQRQERSRSYRSVRRRLLRKDPRCRWCGMVLDLETSTLDHIVPLARGGLDTSNNQCLACRACNQERGCNMPEVTQEAYVYGQRESHCSQSQSGGAGNHHPARPILERHPRGVDDAPHVLPECEFVSGDPDQETP